MDELQLDGDIQELTLTTLDKVRIRVSSCVVSLEVAAMDGDFHSPGECANHTIDTKRSNIGQQCDLKQRRHLRNLEISEVDAISVSLLISQDNPDILMPRELRSGDVGDPYGTRTLLRWTMT